MATKKPTATTKALQVFGKTFEYKTFDRTKLRFGRKTTKGRSTVPLKYGSEVTAVRWQTPVECFPFGISAFKNQQDKIDLKITMNVTDPEYARFCMEFDEAVVDVAVQRSEDWFGIKKSREQVLERYVPLLKPAKEEYSPTNKFTVTTKGDRATLLLDPLLEPLPSYEDVPNFSEGSILVEAPSIYFIGKTSFGITGVARQVFVIPQVTNEPCFDLSDPKLKAAREAALERKAIEEQKQSDIEMPDADAAFVARANTEDPM